jgi:hypothetical protein
MALSAAVQGLRMPDFHHILHLSNNAAYTSLLMDASAEKVGYVFTVPKSGTLSTVAFKTGTVTAADTLRVSFQDVDTSTGNPDGTPDQYRTIASGSVASDTWLETGIISSDGTDTGTKRTVTKGERLAIVIDFNSFVAGNLNIASGLASTSRYHLTGQNYVLHFTASWAKQAAQLPNFALKYDDGTYAYIAHSYAASNCSTTTYANNTVAQDEIALKFRNSFPCKIRGLWVAGLTLNGNTDIVLYDSDGTTPLKTMSLPLAVKAAFPVGFDIPFDSDVTLNANTYYRISIKPTTTTTITVYWFEVSAAVVMDQISGGQDYHWSDRVDAGSWTDVTTKRIWAGVEISTLDDGASAGGSIFNVME